LSLVAAGFLPGARAATGAVQVAASSPPSYEVLRLGTFQGGRSEAFALSSNRMAAGLVSFSIDGGYRPALFLPNQVPKPIYTDGPGEARGVNARLETVGWFRQGSFTQAFRWRNDTLETLASLGGGHSYAAAINNRSEIVGWSEAAPGASHAMYWQRDHLFVDLGTWGGYAAQATGLNERGDIVGFREVVLNGIGVRQGVMYLRGKSPQLLPTPPGYECVVPSAINDQGVITGVVYPAANYLWGRRAFLYANGQYTLFSSPYNFPTAGLSLNNKGQVVGYSFDQGADPRNGATLWLDQGQTTAFLSPGYVPAIGGWYRLGDAWAINDAGVIVGTGRYMGPNYSSNATEAFMLVPKK